MEQQIPIETDRKMASIQVIKALAPIPGADMIQSATVKGWPIVVKKGEFEVGDKCVFFEVDAILPIEKEWAAFMAPRGGRVKTCKFRKALSQGLALPLDILPEDASKEIDADVTEALGVGKWEEPPSGRAEFAGARPWWIPKTDEIRVQSEPEKTDELKGHPYYLSIKYDGQSGSFGRFEGEFVAASRSRKMKSPEDAKAAMIEKVAEMRAEGKPEEEIPDPEKMGPSTWWFVARKYNLEEKMPEGFVLQGEVYGPGIQKNRLDIKEVDLAAFNVWNIKEGRYLDLDEFLKFCEDLGVPTVKIEERGDNFQYTMEELLEKADGKYEGTKNYREGLVIRSQSYVNGSRISFKAISNKYLLKYDL